MADEYRFRPATPGSHSTPSPREPKAFFFSCSPGEQTPGEVVEFFGNRSEWVPVGHQVCLISFQTVLHEQSVLVDDDETTLS
jgi:hypothetical protein